MSGPSRWLSATGLTAGLAWRDVLRRPGSWMATVATGVLFAVLLLGVGAVTDRTQDRVEGRSFRVALGGDLDGGRALADRLTETDRLVPETFDDPFAEVAEQRAAVALIVPEGADADLAAGRTIEIRTAYRPASPVSVEALVTLLLEVQELELLTAGDVVAPVVIEPESIVRDARVGRIVLARQAAAVVALLCVGVVSAVAATFGGARERRALEPMLVLPVPRSSLAAGVAIGGFPVAAVQLLAALVVLIATSLLSFVSYTQSLATVIEMLARGVAATALLGLVAVSVGALAGSLGTGTEDAVSLGDLLALPFVVSGLTLFLVPDLSSAWSIAPVLGPAVLVRDAVLGSVTPAEVVAATLSAGLTAAGVLALAGRKLGDERRVLRVS